MQIKAQRNEEFNQDIYEFTARKVEYTIIVEEDKSVQVWSQRLNQPVINVYNNFEELAARGKMFANFVKLITA